ncbi:MAG: RNA polymerase sigma factor [Akkermansiaceae bacterium]
MSSPFQPTRWTLVQRVREESPDVARRALNELCEIYWRPLYVYARGFGRVSEDAEDMVQGFLVHGVEHALFSTADPGKGKMRSFLLTAFKRYMRDEWVKQNAIKRGGGTEMLDFSSEERCLQGTVEDPAKEYDRRWAVQVVDESSRKIKDRYEADGKLALYEAISPVLAGDLERAYIDVADELEMSESAVKVAVHRLRKRFAETLREEVQQTLDEGEDVDEEIRYLFKVLGDV